MNIVTGNTLPEYVFATDTVAHLHAQFEVADVLADTSADDLSHEDKQAFATALVVKEFTDRLHGVHEDDLEESTGLVQERTPMGNPLRFIPRRQRVAAAFAASAASLGLLHAAPNGGPVLAFFTAPAQWAQHKIDEQVAECFIFGVGPDATKLGKAICVEAVEYDSSGAELMEEAAEVGYGYPNEVTIEQQLGVHHEGNVVPVIPSERGDR